MMRMECMKRRMDDKGEEAIQMQVLETREAHDDLVAKRGGIVERADHQRAPLLCQDSASKYPSTCLSYLHDIILPSYSSIIFILNIDR